MNRLIKDGDIILDGTLNRAEKEKEAFAKLERIEEIEEKFGKVDMLVVLQAITNGIWIRHGKNPYFVPRENLMFNLNDRVISIVENQYETDNTGLGECIMYMYYSTGYVNVEDYGYEWALTKEGFIE